MEKGAKALARMLLVALVMGLVIVLVNPVYRDTAKALMKGQPELSPLWLSNQSYYSEIRATPDLPDDQPK